jgi:hypothetical protein
MVALERDWADILHDRIAPLSTLCQINYHVHIGSSLEMPLARSGSCHMQHCVSWAPGAVPVPNHSPSADKQAIRNLEGGGMAWHRQICGMPCAFSPARRCRCVAVLEGTKTQNPQHHAPDPVPVGRKVRLQMGGYSIGFAGYENRYDRGP